MQFQALEEFERALGRVVAEKVKEFEHALALRDAEAKLFQAQTKEQLHAMIQLHLVQMQQTVTAHLSTLKDGKDGKDGEPGPIGFDGQDGKQGPEGYQGAPGEKGEPGPSGPSGPMGLTGENGERGERGERGEQGLIGFTGDRGEKGIDGRDGMPGRDGLHGQQGERGTSGKDGRDGIDGKDGAGFDTLGVEFDEDKKELVIVFGSGERQKEFSIMLPIPMYRGKWIESQIPYLRGDEVTFGGQVFRAITDTDSKPGPTSDHWRVSANRGRDGRDGKDGERGPEGKEGKPGRDLTQLGPDGKKW